MEAGGAASHDDGARESQLFLALSADFLKQNLARVPVFHLGDLRVLLGQFQGDYLSLAFQTVL